MRNTKEYNKKWYKKNRERIIEGSKQYNNDNKEKIKKYQKKYSKDYYKKNITHLLDRSKTYYIKNKIERLIYSKRRRENNKGKIREDKRIYWLKKRDKIKQQKNESRRQLGLPLIEDKQYYSEMKLFIYISSLFKKEEIIRNSRSFLNGLQLDIFIPSLKIAFEYNGYQHYYFPNHFFKTKEEFELQQFRDKKKQELCRERGVILIVFKYDEELSLLNVLKKLKDNDILIKTQTELKTYFLY